MRERCGTRRTMSRDERHERARGGVDLGSLPGGRVWLSALTWLGSIWCSFDHKVKQPRPTHSYLYIPLTISDACRSSSVHIQHRPELSIIVLIIVTSKQISLLLARCPTPYRQMRHYTP